jgi:hypothetical protein
MCSRGVRVCSKVTLTVVWPCAECISASCYSLVPVGASAGRSMCIGTHSNIHELLLSCLQALIAAQEVMEVRRTLYFNTNIGNRNIGGGLRVSRQHRWLCAGDVVHGSYGRMYMLPACCLSSSQSCCEAW